MVVLAGTLSTGFEYPEIRFSLTTTARAYSLPTKKPKKRKGEEIRSLSDLSPGDYVVHVTHGIGVFDGIHKLELQGVVKDYIKIKYAGSDILYVPVTQLDLVSKYIGPREGRPTSSSTASTRPSGRRPASGSRRRSTRWRTN